MSDQTWCGKDFKRRTFVKYKPIICYNSPEAAKISKSEYDDLRFQSLMGNLIESFIIEKKTAKTWSMLKGNLCRISLCEGSQVADLNFWNFHNTKEHFYSGKTRQLHSSHLKVYDRLWSCFPYLRPMATFVFDSLKDYGIDEDGGALHDVIGTRCDDYTYKLITGKERFQSCHSYLTEAIKRERGMKEADVHDVWNVFMCTGFTKVS